MRRFAGTLVVLGLLGLAVTLTLWWLPADDFIFTPNTARPLGDRVVVEDSRPVGQDPVYFVDVFVRRLRVLEQLLPFTRPDGSTTVPASDLLPHGTSEEERDRQNYVDMQRSEQIASAVALQTLGYDVVETPRGALVIGVYSDVPAAAKLDPGDVIVAVDGVPVKTPDELRAEIGKREPGDEVRLTIRRDGASTDVTVRTVASPSDSSRPIIGISVDQDAKIELPLDVDIDLGDVGGPSAGLPFALEIARQLGRRLADGCRVAATGELALDGTVVSIGGVEQKTIGVRRADVDIFVVPAGRNAKEARKYADGVRILPVESFQQAFRKLTTSGLKC
ncbi:MAG TPA: PDZ domain-containing protein [Gaiellaceae bacterium]|nr:PDZ domain-containing protein [Gaiellaceae bacterium]